MTYDEWQYHLVIHIFLGGQPTLATVYGFKSKEAAVANAKEWEKIPHVMVIELKGSMKPSKFAAWKRDDEALFVRPPALS
jgi:hypothetical protein